MSKTKTLTGGDWFNRDSEVALVGALAAVTLLVDTVGTWGLSIVVGVGVRPLVLLVVLTTVTIGRTARWGIVVGLLVSGFLIGNWPAAVATAFAAFAAATVCGRLWNANRDRSMWLQWAFHYAVVAVLTTAAFAGITAWLSDLFGIAAFSIVVVQSLTGNLALVLVGAPAVWLSVGVARKRGIDARGDGVSPRITALTFVVLSVWVGGGFLGSFLYQAAATVPVEAFSRSLGPIAERIVVLGGPQGRHPVFVLGVLAVLTLVATFRYDRAS